MELKEDEIGHKEEAVTSACIKFFNVLLFQYIFCWR